MEVANKYEDSQEKKKKHPSLSIYIVHLKKYVEYIGQNVEAVTETTKRMRLITKHSLSDKKKIF